MIKFVFGLDGVVAKEETLSVIAEHLCITQKVEHILKNMWEGNTPFLECYIQYLFVLKEIPLFEMHNALSKVKLHEKILGFINEHSRNCVIVTENLNCWLHELNKKFECPVLGSESQILDGKISDITKIIKKQNVVSSLQKEGNKVVYIGDRNNDMEAMRLADISIASGLTHQPAASILSIADYLIYDEEALCRQLNLLC